MVCKPSGERGEAAPEAPREKRRGGWTWTVRSLVVCGACGASEASSERRRGTTEIQCGGEGSLSEIYRSVCTAVSGDGGEGEGGRVAGLEEEDEGRGNTGVRACASWCWWIAVRLLLSRRMSSGVFVPVPASDVFELPALGTAEVRLLLRSALSSRSNRARRFASRIFSQSSSGPMAGPPLSSAASASM